MKEIFVSVQEFLNNGGNIEVGRPIYWGGNEYQKGTYQSHSGELLYIDQSAFPLNTESALVKINCKPIYK